MEVCHKKEDKWQKQCYPPKPTASYSIIKVYRKRTITEKTNKNRDSNEKHKVHYCFLPISSYLRKIKY